MLWTRIDLLTLVRIEPRFVDRPADSLIAILTEHYRADSAFCWLQCRVTGRLERWRSGTQRVLLSVLGPSATRPDVATERRKSVMGRSLWREASDVMLGLLQRAGRLKTRGQTDAQEHSSSIAAQVTVPGLGKSAPGDKEFLGERPTRTAACRGDLRTRQRVQF
jgi:hypothetical protein